MVAFDIQDAGPGYGAISFSKIGSGKEASFPPPTPETNAMNTAGGEGLGNPVAIAKLVEVTAGSAAEAVEAVKLRFGSCAGKSRAAVKPNTNFKTVTP